MEKIVTIDYLDDRVLVTYYPELASDRRFINRIDSYIESKDTFPWVLHDSLSMEYIHEFVEKINSLSESKGYEVRLTSQFNDFCDRQDRFIDSRIRIGTNLKKGAIVEEVEINREEFSRILSEAMVRPLKPEQMNDAFYMCAMKKVSNFSVPGSGKTSTTLGMYKFLQVKDIVNRILVIGPISSFQSWVDEYTSSFGIEPNYYNVKDRNPDVADLEIRRLNCNGCELLLFNYESLRRFGDKLGDIIDDRTMIVFDEVHRVKSTNGVNARYALELASKANYLVALTGTPIPNGYTDIYNLFNMILGKNYNDILGYGKQQLDSIKPTDLDEIDDINRRIQPFFCRTTKEKLGIKPANPDSIHVVKASDVECQLYQEVMKQCGNSKLTAIIRILQLESDPSMIFETLDVDDKESFESDLSISEDSLVIDDVNIEDAPTSKMIKCIDLASSIVEEGKSLIIWCVFRKSIVYIANNLRSRGYKVCEIYGATDVADRVSLLNSFKKGEYQVLVSNPHTLAESVSLHNVCHDAIYFEYSYNLVHLLQSKDRIHRLGIASDQYTQYHFLQTHFDFEEMGGCNLDSAIYERLDMKNNLMINAIDNDRLEIMPLEKDDVEKIFGKLFRPSRIS